MLLSFFFILLEFQFQQQTVEVKKISIKFGDDGVSRYASSPSQETKRNPRRRNKMTGKSEFSSLSLFGREKKEMRKNFFEDGSKAITVDEKKLVLVGMNQKN